MATITLSISPNYCKDWTFVHAVREIVQNGRDGAKRGHKFSIDATEGGKIKFTNEGVVLQKSTLCLGGGDKGNDSGMAGKFGEGYKLAVLVLLRNGVDVRVRTGAESWHFYLERDVTLDAIVIRVNVTRATSFVDRLTFQLEAREQDKATLLEAVKSVQVPENARAIQAGEGARILLDEALRGRVYSHGLLVGNFSRHGLLYGYDLASLELNRDRSVPDAWSLSCAVGTALLTAAGEKALPDISVLLSDSFEGRSLEAANTWRESVQKGLKEVANFLTGGRDDVAITANVEEKVQAEARAIKTVLVNPRTEQLLKAHTPTVDQVAAKAGVVLVIESVVTEDPAAFPSDLALVLCALETAGIILPSMTRLVKFTEESKRLGHIRKLADGVEVMDISVGLTGNARPSAALIDTVVHEVAHRLHDTHGSEHDTEMHRIFGMVCASLLAQ